MSEVASILSGHPGLVALLAYALVLVAAVGGGVMLSRWLTRQP